MIIAAGMSCAAIACHVSAVRSDDGRLVPATISYITATRLGGTGTVRFGPTRVASSPFSLSLFHPLSFFSPVFLQFFCGLTLADNRHVELRTICCAVEC